MKKFLSIKNSQGIYVARASFSSDETVIDFVNNKSTDNSYNRKPVSIVVTPDQLTVASSSSEPIIESADDTHSVQSESVVVAKSSSSKKKRLNKVLRLLHLKKKTTTTTTTKMSEHLNEDAAKKSPDNLPSTSSSFPMLPTPKPVRSKGRTAALVKKFSLTPKKSPPKELSVKKSAIPLRTATSVETISNTPQLALQNRVETTASVSHHSMSEMNLVNIDYRQESGDNLDVGVKVAQTQYRTIRNSIGSSSIDGSGANSNLSRGWNASSNLSIKSGVSSSNNSNNKMQSAGGRKSTSTEKLQITISGKKRINTADLASDSLQRKQQPSSTIEIEPKKIERKAVTMQQQQPSKKLNINHDLTLMNTVGVPPAPTTQAPSTIPSYRGATTTVASIKNVVQRGATIKAQSTMQSQQSVDTSASAANVGQIGTKQAELLSITSFDVETPEDIAASEVIVQEKDSLFTEIVEAERRNSMSMDLPETARGRRYPGVAASETIKFAHQSTSSSDSGGSDTKSAPPLPTTQPPSSSSSSSSSQPQPEIIPKVIIDEVASLLSEKLDEQSKSKSDNDKSNDDKDTELLHTLAQSNGAKVLQPNADDNETTQPALQFEVGKQVRPIYPSNQNLHHNTYSALDNDPATAYTSILTTSSYIDTHNSDSFAHVHGVGGGGGGGEPLSAPNIVNVVNDIEQLIDHDHELNQITMRSQQQNSRGRRRIAYVEQSSSKSAAGSPSTSNSTINTEDDDDILPENQPDSLLTSQFDDDLHTSSTFVTDFVMPPYGDLVWDDDGVIERISTKLSFFLSSFCCAFCVVIVSFSI